MDLKEFTTAGEESPKEVNITVKQEGILMLSAVDATVMSEEINWKAVQSPWKFFIQSMRRMIRVVAALKTH